MNEFDAMNVKSLKGMLAYFDKVALRGRHHPSFAKAREQIVAMIKDIEESEKDDNNE